MSDQQFDGNWVGARKACSLPVMFLTLKELVQRDIGEIQGYARERFEMKSHPNGFIVTKSWDAGGVQSGEATVFELLPNGAGIRVKDSGTERELFIATPELDRNGVCRLRVAGERDALELWQVSRKALETFFFG